MHFLRYSLILMLAMLSFSLVAGSGTNSQELTFFRTGKQSNIIVVVGGKNNFTNNEGCEAGRAALGPNTNNAKFIYSQLLTAYSMNKKVHFYGNGCITADSTTYINIEYVYFD